MPSNNSPNSGLYGVMSYLIARRTIEIGMRMAMGTSRSTIVSMVLRGALVQVLIGLALGIPASLYVSHLMKPVVSGTRERSGSAARRYRGIGVVHRNRRHCSRNQGSLPGPNEGSANRIISALHKISNCPPYLSYSVRHALIGSTPEAHAAGSHTATGVTEKRA